MIVTDKLRRMLDERGVEWTADDGEYVKETCWPYMGELMAAFAEYYDGTTRFACDTWCFTPEQAVKATLGARTCRDVCNSVSEFTCSACGFNCDLTSWISLFDGDDGRHQHHHHGTPNFCPNCGAKVVEEL